MDLNLVSRQQLIAIEHTLNHRPRNVFGFEFPHEVCPGRVLLETLTSVHRGCRASGLNPPSCGASQARGIRLGSRRVQVVLAIKDLQTFGQSMQNKTLRVVRLSCALRLEETVTGIY